MIKPDEKLRWLLETGLLHDMYSRHEAFTLLESSFAQASEDVKKMVWEQGRAAYEELITEDRPLEPVFAVWINRIDPEFEPAASAVASYTKQHPDWEPPEHPEFLYYVGDVEVISPRVLPKELEAEPSFDALRQIELADPSSLGASTLQDAVANLVRKRPQVGLEVLAGVVNEGVWDSVLWGAAVWGLEDAQIPAESWPTLIEMLTSHVDPDRALDSLSRVVLGAARADPPSIASNHFPTIAGAVFGQLTRLQEAGQDAGDPGEDLMFTALNSWPGRLAEVFVAEASQLERAEKDPCATPGLVEFLHAAYEARDTNWARVAIAALARDFPYLWERCPDQVRATLLRTFSWEEPRVAPAAWQGIAYGRWSIQTVEALEPLFTDVCKNLEKLTDDSIRGLLNVLAATAVRQEAGHPTEPPWLTSLVANNSDGRRAEFAAMVRRQLETAEADERHKTWTGWLRDWLAKRLEGFPVPVGPEEGSMIIGWVLPLAGLMEEVLPLALHLELAPQTWTLLYDLRDSNLPTTQPTALARLVTHVLGQRGQLYDHDIVVEILQRAHEAGADRDAILDACNAIASLGGELPEFCYQP